MVACRSFVNPNTQFKLALAQYEVKVRGTTSVSHHKWYHNVSRRLLRRGGKRGEGGGGVHCDDIDGASLTCAQPACLCLLISVRAHGHGLCHTRTRGGATCMSQVYAYQRFKSKYKKAPIMPFRAAKTTCCATCAIQ